MMKKGLEILVATFLVLGFCLLVAFCAGVIRPPRPMFSDSYGPGGFGLVSYWIPNSALADDKGQWLWFDGGDNVLAIHATGVAERGRSHAMAGGRTAARFRLGRAWDDERDNHYVTIPRTQNALVVILPDGKWQAFPLNPRQAVQIFDSCRGGETSDLLRRAGAFLDGDGEAQFERFLEGYVPPISEAEKARKNGF